MKITKPSVTVGITAYNEAGTIQQLVKSIYDQDTRCFVLNTVHIITDGSTDNTPKVVEQLMAKYATIKFDKSNNNLGKATRLNQIFRSNKSDIIIVLDADILIEDSNIFNKLVTKFSTTEKVGIVSSNNQPMQAKSLVGKIVCSCEKLWYEIRKDANNGDNIYNNSGCAVALSRGLAKEIHLPKLSVSDQHIIYTSAKKLGYKFIFVKDAIVYYSAQNTIHDWLTYLARTDVTDTKTSSGFMGLKEEEYRVPISNRISGTINFAKDNFLIAIIVIIWLQFSKLVRFTSDPLTKRGSWKSLRSTKEWSTNK